MFLTLKYEDCPVPTARKSKTNPTKDRSLCTSHSHPPRNFPQAIGAPHPQGPLLNPGKIAAALAIGTCQSGFLSSHWQMLQSLFSRDPQEVFG